MIRLSFILIFTLITGYSIASEFKGEKPQTIKVLANNYNQGESLDYFNALLDAALHITQAEFGSYKLQTNDLPYSQARSLEFLDDEKGLDVMHTMTNSDRELKYQAIKVPLLKGLMGYRMLLTNEENFPKLQQIETLKDFRNLIACQGTHWPDSDILEHNGLQVARVLLFESMYEMVAKGRCDFFPRGIHEISPEFESFSAKHDNLKIDRHLMLQYHAPVYFFVGKKNKPLASRIELGLNKLIANGEFDTMFKNNPITGHIFPLSKWQNVKVIQLENPMYKDSTNENTLRLGTR